MNNRLSEVIDAIDRLTAKHGYPPTLSEIGAELGIVKSLVHYYIQMGVRHGLITYESRKTRTLKTLK